MYREFFPLTDGVVTLCQHALKEIKKNFSPKRLFLQNRPSLYPQYGKVVNRSEARAKLKMDNDAIYLGHLGRATHYKNIPFLIAAVRELRKTVSSDLRLFIAGAAVSREYKQEISELCGDGIECRIDHIPEKEVATYLAAFDVSVFGFNEIWVSASMILALSYGCPVIAPKVGGLPEYLSENGENIFYTPGDIKEFSLAVQNILKKNLTADRTPRIVEFSRKYPLALSAYQLFVARNALRREIPNAIQTEPYLPL